MDIPTTYLLTILIVLCLISLGAALSISLIGNLPRQPGGPEFGQVEFGKHTINAREFAIGIMLFIYGAVWLALWGYFLFIGTVGPWNKFDLHEFKWFAQFIMSGALILGGFSVFTHFKNWQRVYFICIGLIIVSFGFAITYLLPTDAPDHYLMYCLGGLTVIAVTITTAINFSGKLSHLLPPPPKHSH